ncbi:hypothetical protein GCM10029964_085720 [Kibdelosporangium lantanae]
MYDPVPTLRAVLTAAHDAPAGLVAARFHQTVAEVAAALAEWAVRVTGVRVVCLSGGVFQNRRLAGTVLDLLAGLDLDGRIGERVPVNDGGISYGQAAIAAARMARGG